MKAGNPWHSAPPTGNPTSVVETPGTRNRALLQWSGYLLCVIGILALSYCGWVLFEARLYQAYQSWRFDGALKGSQSVVSSGELRPQPALPVKPEAVPALIPVAGALLGRMEIGRIGLAAMVMEGIDRKTLRHAVGHIPGTALPGVPGNVGIAGHRDTFFRGLQSIRKEDEITLTTLDGIHRYRVVSMRVVEPREVRVLEDDGQSVLTLVTCYPFYYVGPAPQRFIVRARKIAGQ